jgi:hypothetical protein
MEQFKIQICLAEHPGEQHPRIHSVEASVCQSILNRIAEKVGIQQPDTQNLIMYLHALAHAVPENALDDNFDLAAVLSREGIIPLNTLFINWGDFSELDEMPYLDLCRWFQYVWYPSSDDIDIFDSSLSWFLHVYHSGTIAISGAG